jgi:16S rRNA G527 N7-methylase RsmG
VEKLKLSNTTVINSRLEEIRHKYDVIFSRALGKPDKVFIMLKPLLNPQGLILFWTKRSFIGEFDDCNLATYNIESSGKLLLVQPKVNQLYA